MGGEKKIIGPDKQGGIVTHIYRDGKKEEIVLWPEGRKTFEGDDGQGTRIQMRRMSHKDWEAGRSSRYVWRYLKERKEEEWSPWFTTYYSPTEQINELEEDSPTIARLYKTIGGKPQGNFPYSEIWRRFKGDNIL